MSRVPDFTALSFAARDTALPTGAPWTAPEGIAIKPAYRAADAAGLAEAAGYPGLPPYTRGPYATMYSHSHGRYANMPASPRRRIPTPFTGATGARPDGAVGGIRPADPSRL